MHDIQSLQMVYRCSLAAVEVCLLIAGLVALHVTREHGREMPSHKVLPENA